MDTEQLLNSARRTITIERDAIEALGQRIDGAFEQACKLIENCQGRVVVTGMGKSGHIGSKIAATLASTGTLAFFVHPGEASHGDMGMITAGDVVIALSNSGTTAELLTLIPLLKRQHVPIIAFTGNPQSELATVAEAHLDVSVKQEACPLDLAPTASTTAALVMGDALAIALLEARGFTAEQFAFSHPGGALGRKLLLKVGSIMHRGDAIPKTLTGTPVTEALFEMSSKSLGMTTILDEQGKMLGLFTDGDLRRAIDQKKDINNVAIDVVMTKNPLSVDAELLAAEALNLMESKQITALVVLDSDSRPEGVLHLHDLLKAGVA